MIHHGLNPAETPVSSMLTYLEHALDAAEATEDARSDDAWWEGR